MKIKKVQLIPAAENGISSNVTNPPEPLNQETTPVSSSKAKSKSKKLQPNSVGSLNASTSTTATTSSPVPTQKRTKRRKKQSSSPTTTPSNSGSTPVKDSSLLKRRRIVKDLSDTPPSQSQDTPPNKKVLQKMEITETDDFSAFFDRPPTPEEKPSVVQSEDITEKAEEEGQDQTEEASAKSEEPYLDDNYPYIHVFPTNLANAAAEAIQNGKFSSIIAFHRDAKGDPAKILMEKEKQMRREANLARLKQIGGMLNIYSKKRPSDSQKQINGDDRKKPRSSTTMTPRLHRAGPPERFGSLTDFSRRNPPPIPYGAGPVAELQTAPSPQHMNYEIHGQELIITRQLNPRHKPSADTSSPMIGGRDQMAEPLNHMLHMTNNIPRPASDSKRMPSPKSDYIPSAPPTNQQHTPQQRPPVPPRPRMMYMDMPPPSVMPNFGNGGCHPLPPRMMIPPHAHHAPPVNNTFVNATMSIQQLNIQSMPEGNQHPQQLVMAGGNGGGPHPPQHVPHSYMVPMDHHHPQQQPMMTMPPHHHRMQFNPMMRPRCMGPPTRFRPPPHMDGMMMTPSPAQMMNKQFIDAPPQSNGAPPTPMMMQRMMMPPPSQMMCPPQRFMYCGGGPPHHQMMEMRPDQMMMPMDHHGPLHHPPSHYHFDGSMMDGSSGGGGMMQHQPIMDSGPMMQQKPQQRMMPPTACSQQMFHHSNEYGAAQMYVESAPSANADLMNSPAFLQPPQQPPPADQYLNSGTCNQ